MNVFQGALLGLIQGLGEFLPVSSSGHLLLARFLLGIQNAAPDVQASYKVLDILLHVGTLIPLVIVFWKDWVTMLRHPVKNRLVIYLAAKVLFPNVGGPGVSGFAVFDSGWFLGASFLITALFLLLCDLISTRRPRSGKGVGPLQAVVMGLFQGIGMIPGVSRSGSTIFGGVLSGLDKKKAASFSFMMSAPAILGSLIMEGKDALDEGYFKHLEPLPTLVGILVAAVAGYFALRFMLKIIAKVPMSVFAVYLAVIGIIFLVMQLSGSSLLPAFSAAAAIP